MSKLLNILLAIIVIILLGISWYLFATTTDSKQISNVCNSVDYNVTKLKLKEIDEENFNSTDGYWF